jgi:transcriptional regulator NrdR family protein
MTIPTATALLEVWERSLAEPMAVKAFALLALACPEVSLEEMAGWSVGRRDRTLLGLRQGLFGTRLESVTHCPRCAQKLELTFATHEVMTEFVPVADVLELKTDGHRVQFRLPTVQDMVQVARQSPQNSAQTLLERCVLEVQTMRKKKQTALASDQLLNAVGAAMAEADPQALIELALECPACAHPWLAVFDIVSYLWRELDSWARATLHDVHLLARAYGWHEADVLALSVHRRRLYLELVGA